MGHVNAYPHLELFQPIDILLFMYSYFMYMYYKCIFIYLWEIDKLLSHDELSSIISFA